MPRPAVRRDRPLLCRVGPPAVLLLMLGCLLPPLPAAAQPDPGVYAVTGARLVTLSGAPIERGTIVLRDGLIEALGTDLEPPPDALTVDGDGLTVYPGFIDAFSQAGIVLPEGREYAGNLADRPASEHFDPGARNLEDYLKQGFTTALLVRDDAVFGGGAVLMNLIGEDVSSMTVKAPVVQTLGYAMQRDYPGTLMAVVAYQRQTLIDAAYQDLLLNRYRREPRGMVRPPVDRALEALIPVATGRAPLLVIVQSENDLKRLRDLGRDYGVQYWIAGAQEAWRVPELIRSAGAPVIVSLDFPPIESVTGYWYDRAFRHLEEAESEAFDDRDEAAVHGNAAAVATLGVPLALGTGGMRDPDSFLENLRLAISAGLPAATALDALTRTPARLFGVEAVLGSLEPGKIANLTITGGGDIFSDSEAYIAHVFVDGRKRSFEKPRPRASGPAAAGPAGEWDLEINAEGMTIEMTLTLELEGTDVTAVIVQEGEEMHLSGTFSEGELSLQGTIPDESAAPITLTATIEGNEMRGSLGVAGMGTFTLTGTKKPGSIPSGEGGSKDD